MRHSPHPQTGHSKSCLSGSFCPLCITRSTNFLKAWPHSGHSASTSLLFFSSITNHPSPTPNLNVATIKSGIIFFVTYTIMVSAYITSVYSYIVLGLLGLIQNNLEKQECQQCCQQNKDKNFHFLYVDGFVTKSCVTKLMPFIYQN